VPRTPATVTAVVAVASELVRDANLLDQVEGVKAEMPLGDVERHRNLAGRQEPQRRHALLDDESTAGLQMTCGVEEAVDLFVLR
jgi:hypothetical protein